MIPVLFWKYRTYKQNGVILNSKHRAHHLIDSATENKTLKHFFCDKIKTKYTFFIFMQREKKNPTTFQRSKVEADKMTSIKIDSKNTLKLGLF